MALFVQGDYEMEVFKKYINVENGVFERLQSYFKMPGFIVDEGKNVSLAFRSDGR